MTEMTNKRILLIDDNPSIHEDFTKILAPEIQDTAALTDMRAAFLGGGEPAKEAETSNELRFELHSAHQGEDGYDMLCKACDDGNPYAMAFVDMRMPPGWDGVKTISKLWERDPDLQVVICTAFSDYTWDETIEILGTSDRLLILKKPFDSIEITMLASALVAKWNMGAREKELLNDTQRSEMEAKSYAASLETVNRALVTSKAASEMALEIRTELLVQVSNEVNRQMADVVTRMGDLDLNDISDNEVESVIDASQHLVSTLNGILDVTALEQGKQEVVPVPCSPRAVAEDVLGSLDERSKEKGIALELSLEGSVPDMLMSEPVRMRQVLTNLLENAIQHTSAGSVRLVIRPGTTEDWQRPTLLFEVYDTGAGIPLELQGSVFEPVARGAENGAGFGFGLSLARRLAVFLGGDLTVRSEEGNGCCFTFELRYDHLQSESGSPAAS
jgi:two-component system, sensor histidine kinase and response regulator